MSFGLILIEVCDANLACDRRLFELEEEFQAVSILETACMSQCELCARHPYVYLNGEIVSASSVEELLDNLRKKVVELTASL